MWRNDCQTLTISIDYLSRIKYVPDILIVAGNTIVSKTDMVSSTVLLLSLQPNGLNILLSQSQKWTITSFDKCCKGKRNAKCKMQVAMRECNSPKGKGSAVLKRM